MAQAGFATPPLPLHGKHMGKMVCLLIDRVNERAVAFEETALTDQRFTRRIIRHAGRGPSVALDKSRDDFGSQHLVSGAIRRTLGK